MLLEKSPSDMGRFIQELLPSLLNALTDDADDVVLMNLQASQAKKNKMYISYHTWDRVSCFVVLSSKKTMKIGIECLALLCCHARKKCRLGSSVLRCCAVKQEQNVDRIECLALLCCHTACSLTAVNLFLPVCACCHPVCSGRESYTFRCTY